MAQASIFKVTQLYFFLQPHLVISKFLGCYLGSIEGQSQCFVVLFQGDLNYRGIIYTERKGKQKLGDVVFAFAIFDPQFKVREL